MSRLSIASILSISLLACYSQGQPVPSQALTNANGTVTMPVTMPVATGQLGSIDPKALAEVVSYRAALGGSSLIGVQGTGQISFGTIDQTKYAATLSLHGSRQVRLDTETAKGPVSIRIDRQLGRMQNQDGSLSTLPVETAMSGLFSFLLPMEINPRNQDLSIRDGGELLVGTALLHKITLERRSVGVDPKTHLPNTSVVDLYFNPTTHLLTRSVVNSLTEGRRVRFLDVTDYSDYRLVGTSMVPFRFVESMQGEPFRTLQLSSAELKPTFGTGYFTFQ